MATATWSTVLDHTSTAGFRAWGSELSANLAAIGLVKVTTSGNNNIDWTTVTIPATNTDAGYEIWRFNDTQQSAAPIYIKLLYGTASTSASPRLGFQLGSGVTNGTLNGQNTAPVYEYTSSVQNNSTIARPSYLSYSDGFFGLVHKYLGYGFDSTNGRGTAQFYVCRTVDSNQTPTSTGASVYSTSSSSPFYAQLRFASTAANSQTTSATSWGGCSVPGLNATTSVIPTNPGVYRSFVHLNCPPNTQPTPLIGVCTINTNDIPYGTSFTTTLFGSTSRTYFSLGPCGASTGYMAGAEVNGSTSFGTAILWE